MKRIVSSEDYTRQQRHIENTLLMLEIYRRKDTDNEKERIMPPLGSYIDLSDRK